MALCGAIETTVVDSGFESQVWIMHKYFCVCVCTLI